MRIMREKRYCDVPAFLQRFSLFLLVVVITTYCSAGQGQTENSLKAHPKQKETLDPDNHDKLTKEIELNRPITDSEVRTKLLEKSLKLRDWKSALMLLDEKRCGSIDDDLDRFIELVSSTAKAEDSTRVEVLRRLYIYKIQSLQRKKKKIEQSLEKGPGCCVGIASEPV